MKLALRKPDKVARNKKGTLDVDASNESLYVSNEVMDQLARQSVGSLRKPFKQIIRKSDKEQGRGNAVSNSPTKVHNETKLTRSVKKALKPSLRRSYGTTIVPSKVTRRGVSIGAGNKEAAGNKAEHNNWMIDSEQTSNTHGSVAMPSYHLKSRSSSFNTYIQANSGTKKEHSFSRADSSDDSGCFSNISIQSSNSLGSEKTERNVEGHAVSGKPAVKNNGFVAGSKLSSCSSGLCAACGSEPVGRGCDLCKNCASGSRPSAASTGPFSELKAYAQSLAESVKKILSLSPGRGQKEATNQSTPEKHTEEKLQSVRPAKNTQSKSNPDVPLHRYMTEIHMIYPQEGRSKGFLNKSVSFDGRVSASLDDRERRSPMYWIGQEKFKVSDSFSKLSDSVSSVEGDYFNSGRDCKHFQDGEKRKPKRKNSLKQLSRVERARTDGDLRANPHQQSGAKRVGKDEHKKGYEIQRSRSKTFRVSDADSDEYSKRPQKNQEEINVMRISRMKVIHEGSSVDPPYTVQRRKSEDAKGRRAILIRSATAPYKNHITKKDNGTADKLGAMEGAVRTNRSNTRITIRTNKASTLRKENSINDKKRFQGYTDTQNDFWRDESCVMSVMPFIRRRSTSYDGSKPVHSKRGDLQRSISWSAIEGDEEGIKHRREAVSVGKMSIKRKTDREDGFSMKVIMPSKFSVRGKKVRQTRKDMQNDSFVRKELSVDSFQYHSREPSNKELSYDKPKDTSPNVDQQVKLRNAQNKSSYFDGVRYYGHDIEKRLSPCMEEESLEEDESIMSFDAGNYYCYTEPPEIDSHLQGNVMKVETVNASTVFKNAEDENIYHDQISKYNVAEIPRDTDRVWYTPETCSDERSALRRDRSHESKSSTSFHVVTTVISSHSDEALIKYSGAWEHLPVRRQSNYTETDVDTGVIYHLAKRQTTRAHVPNYHDLTSASKDIYTMSGDVSTSASSNSAISTKSEISECVYTGGFYKDPFYDNDSKSSTSSSSRSSAGSSSHIYFEPEETSKREPSELDIYTGALFSSSKNALILESSACSVQPDLSSHALKYDSTNNSARPTLGRMSRRLRGRPRIDVVRVGGLDSGCELACRTVVPFGDSQLCNISNNSSNWCGMDEFEGPSNQSTIVTKSKEPMYTDYVPGARPEFHVRSVEKSSHVFDFFKYDSPEETCTSCFFPSAPKDSNSNDNIWYSGQYGQSKEVPEKRRAIQDCSPGNSVFSWQYYDDYYTSTVRPRVTKTNCGAQQNAASNANNNHFEDLYTGAYGAHNVQNYVQEQTHSIRQPQTENWYVQQPPKPASSFYDDDYSFQGQARRPPQAVRESSKNFYSSSGFFGQDAPESSGASSHMSSWTDYDQSYMSPIKNFAEPRARVNPPPERHEKEEKDSYFNYASCRSPRQSFYIIDEDTYSFEEKVVKPPTPVVAVVHEIKKVGGIVCRDNVVNKEDYAEDVNRDLEPGAWVPISFRRDEESKVPAEMGGARSKGDIPKVSETSCQGRLLRPLDDTPYAHNRLYDNLGARNKWRDMANKGDFEMAGSSDSGQHKQHQTGDSRKQDFGKSTAWNSPDIIPDRARGKRTNSNAARPCAAETSNGNSNTSSSKSLSACLH